MSVESSTMKRGAIVFTAFLLLQALAGCTSQVLNTKVDPKAVFTALPPKIQQGEEISFDARDSDPIEGVISEYQWDFGDGTKTTTIAAYTSHQYLTSGQFNVQLTVVNDQGGTDSTTVVVKVNGLPELNLTIPEFVRSGDIVVLDASKTFDPEGSMMEFMWDLNHLEDSDGDGDPRNDVDKADPIVYLETSSSGSITGSVTIDDGEGGVVSQTFTIEIHPRKFRVDWVEETLTWDYEEYLAQGETWSENMTPGEGARVLSFEAILELENDIFLPPDNFTLGVRIVEDGYKKSAKTNPGNVTRNESTNAEINASDLNPRGKEGIFEADSQEELLRALLNEPGARFGQGEWIWTVVAQDADPDSIIPGTIDPDGGNDWTLEIVIRVLTPVLTEVAEQ